MALHRTNDESTLISKAEVLIEALPWLMDHAGKIMVIKYRRQRHDRRRARGAFAQDIVFLRWVRCEAGRRPWRRSADLVHAQAARYPLGIPGRDCG